MSGSLRGLRETSTVTASEPGLYVEVRLTGLSRATSEGFPPIELDGETLHVLGQPQPGNWQVFVPEQPAFEVVSACFPQAFVESLAASDPTSAERIAAKIASRHCSLVPVPQAAHVLAREILLAMAPPEPDKLRLEGLALCLLTAALGTEGSASGIIDQIDAVIARNPPRLWTVAALSAELGVPPTTLKRAASQELGQPIGAYLSEQRLQAARALLSGPLSISKVAEAVGYSTPEALAKAFRSRFGETPTEVRRRGRPV
ncbi:MAG: AraC family transcriptional regulator [Pseudomonadota bacterium]